MSSQDHTTKRFYLVALVVMIGFVCIAAKLVYIQAVEGGRYRQMASEQTTRNFIIEPNRGNLYSGDGNLLATSIIRYTIYFDALAVKPSSFNEHLAPLCDSLSQLLGKPKNKLITKIRKARASKNRYLLLARNLRYSEYQRLRQFPILKLGQYKGGLVVEQTSVRENPLGNIGKRSIGYSFTNKEGLLSQVGLEGAFNDYLKGKKGQQTRQLIAKGQWKPINSGNEIEPEDGNDVVSTIDANIQYIAHSALSKQLQKYKAGHGSVLVMEVATGEIKAVVNLGRTKENKYSELLNYAVGESHEPGSVFKLMILVAGMEQNTMSPSSIVDTGNGKAVFFDKTVRDTKEGGHGKITMSKAFEVSSNVAFAKIIYERYKQAPEKLINKLYDMGLNKKMDIHIKGEGEPYIPTPKDKKKWYGTTLPWMAYGYGVSMTPLQVLSFYNAIANDGVWVKPLLIKDVLDFQHSKVDFDNTSVTRVICSKETARKAKQMMENVIEKTHGTAHNIYEPGLYMAGKTGTTQKNYASKQSSALQYVSSFVGYFPNYKPKYSCIVVIHEPSKEVGYYGADVSAPVFKEICDKTNVYPQVIDHVSAPDNISTVANTDYETYYLNLQKYRSTVPNVEGMAAMDAISLLENLGLRVMVKGYGKVISQSLIAGTKVKKNNLIILELS